MNSTCCTYSPRKPILHRKGQVAPVPHVAVAVQYFDAILFVNNCIDLFTDLAIAFTCADQSTSRKTSVRCIKIPDTWAVITDNRRRRYHPRTGVPLVGPLVALGSF